MRLVHAPFTESCVGATVSFVDVLTGQRSPPKMESMLVILLIETSLRRARTVSGWLISLTAGHGQGSFTLNILHPNR